MTKDESVTQPFDSINDSQFMGIEQMGVIG